MDPNDLLLKAIQARQQKQTSFNYGILTADRYVQTLLDAVGSDVCYHEAAKGMTSFADVMTKAASTLVYSNEDMEVHEKATDEYNSRLPEGVELPKNTLMVFRHTLSTPRKDRDGDILRTEGMAVDPKMLLLWQHVHTMPIGKMLSVALQNKKTLDLWSCIIDLNETSHDAAVMVDNGMGRFSHGFKAREFDKVKVDGKAIGGFDIKLSEVMEESLVSVPANVDADTQDVILSLVEGGKLTSPMMKEIGSSIRENRNTSVAVKTGLEEEDETKSDESDDGREGSDTGTSEEAGVGTDEGSEKSGEEASADTEVKADNKPAFGAKPGKEDDEDKEDDEKEAPICPKCGEAKLVNGKCPKCGYVQGKEKPVKDEEEKKDHDLEGEKKGRTLSASNEKKLRRCKEYADRAFELGPPLECKACIGRTSTGLKDVLSSLGVDEGKDVSELDIKSEVMADWMAHSTKAERDDMIGHLKHLNKIEDGQQKAAEYRSLVKGMNK